MNRVLSQTVQYQAKLELDYLSRTGRGGGAVSYPAPFCEFTLEETAQSVACRFERQVAKYGYRTALRSRGLEITYSELNASANAIAYNLIVEHGTANQPVILLLEQDINEIVALLACFKAGKVCVPLHAGADPKRTGRIVADTQAQLIITDGNNLPRARAAAMGGCAVVNLDEIDLAGPTDAPQRQMSPDALAYILYTSGSTGEPKGVVQSHRNLLHDLRGYTDCFQISPADRLTLFAPCSGAQGMKTALSALVNGAALCLWNVNQQGLAGLASWLAQEHVTIYISAPAIFRDFADTLSGADDFSTIRLIKLGSEALLAADVERYRKYFSRQCYLVNWYSSTETGNVSYKFMTKESVTPRQTVALGYPHADKQILLLDESGRSVGNNAIGEIAVKSRYLPLGYWRRADLTARKYLADPEGGPERICLTGDLGLLRSDGSLEYCGRKDSRVKIRGFAIDVQDVEAVLRSHPGVKEAVVAVVGESAADRRLIGYIVSSAVTAPTITELRRFLRNTLFEHMLPSGFVFVNSLPLTANGKVDRRALPQPSDERPKLESGYVAPATLRQRQLAAIWEKVLGIHPIGAKDSFFDLGGHSLLAVRLVSEIGRAFNKNLVPSLLFQAPTIEQFAELVGRDSVSWSPLMPIQPGGTKSPFFWIHGDSSGAYLSHYLGPDQPLYGLEHQSQDGKAARYTYVESIAAKYFQEIRTVQAEGPYYIGGYSFGALVALELAQQLKDQEDRVGLLVLLDPPEPLVTTSRPSPRAAGNGISSDDGIGDRLRRHRNNLAGRGYRDMFNYLHSRVTARIENLKNGLHSLITKALKKCVARVCLLLGRDLPPSVRSRYILDIYHRARLKYRMRSYNGPVVLFKGDGRSVDYLKNWRRYLGGENFVYEIPGNHLDLRRAPFIHHWAETLKACLERARAAEKLQHSEVVYRDSSQVCRRNESTVK